MVPSRFPIYAALCLPVLAETGLDTLAKVMGEIRGKAPGAFGLRSAGPELTTVKHLLRDWVETRLRTLALRGDEAGLARKLSEELGAAGLFYARRNEVPEVSPSDELVGFLRPVQLRRLDRFLLLQSGLGIDYGFDESAYVYNWSEAGCAALGGLGAGVAAGITAAAPATRRTLVYRMP